LSLEFTLSQKQKLRISPRLRQAINLLQMGRKELSEVIAKELEKNPFLEVAESSPSKDFKSNSYHSNAVENFYEVESKPGLISHLMRQIRTLSLKPKQLEICDQIIGNINNDGFLKTSIEEIAQYSNSSIEEVNQMIEIVQSLDPAGVCAKDLKECLLLQLNQYGLKDSLAYKILEDFQLELETGKLNEISKSLEISLSQIKDALKEIKKLDPAPGRIYSEYDAEYIVPDVVLKKNGADYELNLNNSGIPQLKLSNDLAIDDNAILSKEDLTYIKESKKSASWLLKTIEQRSSTIYKVSNSIIEHQKEFIEKGVEFLKPLILKDIALACDLHESTISRVTTNKYIHTPQGTFELKYFFTSGFNSPDLVAESIKNKILLLIEKEDKAKPLSDSKIVEELLAQDIKVARRTVAKYRESMGIESSSKRKVK